MNRRVVEMEKILELLEQNAKLTPEKIATLLGTNVETVKEKIEQYEKDKVIVSYKTVVDWQKTKRESVNALIELRVTPQRGEGFDKIAERIYNYPEVKSVYLMSGGFDITVMVEGDSMKSVALFVAQKLAPMDNVLSTATHFVLKKYKQEGVIFDEPSKDERSVITL